MRQENMNRSKMMKERLYTKIVNKSLNFKEKNVEMINDTILLLIYKYI